MLVHVFAALVKLGMRDEELMRMDNCSLAEAFIDRCRVDRIGEDAAALAYSEIANVLEGDERAPKLVTHAVDRLEELVGRSSLDSEDVAIFHSRLESGETLTSIISA